MWPRQAAGVVIDAKQASIYYSSIFRVRDSSCYRGVRAAVPLRRATHLDVVLLVTVVRVVRRALLRHRGLSQLCRSPLRPAAAVRCRRRRAAAARASALYRGTY